MGSGPPSRRAKYQSAAVSRTRAGRHPERHAVFVGSGYRAGAFEVEAAYPPGSPPTVNGTTTCHPGEPQRDDIPIPKVPRVIEPDIRDTRMSSVLIQPKGSWTTTDPAQTVEVTAKPNRGASVRVETGVRSMLTRRIAITSSAILAPGHFLRCCGVHRRRVRGQPMSRLLGELTVSHQRPRRGDTATPNTQVVCDSRRRSSNFP